MYDALRLQTLYNRRRRLNLALADMDRRIARIHASIAEVEAELATMVLFVAPLKPRVYRQYQNRVGGAGPAAKARACGACWRMQADSAMEASVEPGMCPRCFRKGVWLLLTIPAFDPPPFERLRCWGCSYECGVEAGSRPRRN